MADVQPFRGLRYDPAVSGDVGALLAPPYDVIDAAQERALLEQSPHNIVRVELSEAALAGREDDTRYARAASTLRTWREQRVLLQDEDPVFYVYNQEFEHEGRRLQRTSLFCRLRLEPWETGAVRPHEATGARAKEDRLRLLRHTRTNVSPIFVLARPEGPATLRATADVLFEAETPDGQRHTLGIVHDTGDIATVESTFRDRPVYIADGHHRYETALAYRDECRARTGSWSGEEPENFVLAALTMTDDPGLVLRPIHRLVRPPTLPSDVVVRLERYFEVDDITPKSYDGTALLRLLARLSAAGASGTAFGALGLEEGRLHLLTLKDPADVQALMPQDRSPAWRSLDATVLEYAVLREALGVTSDDAGSGSAVSYTEDAAQAQAEVESGRWPLAFLMNPTRIEHVLAVADAGDRMPRKSTFFHPKLATGLVLYPFD